MLALEDFKGMSVEQVVGCIVAEYETDEESVNKFEILVAYESVGSWGCDSSSFFLLREKETGELYEVHGSHCSCFGFEGQWTPEKTTLSYLQSDKFYFCCGGYDESEEENRRVVIEYIKSL